MKIPDDVFNTRCRWCHHGQPENGNSEIPDSEIYSYKWRDKLPCKIMAICRADKIPGECLSFTPNAIYGVCDTCQYDNPFAEGYCMRKERPNYRQVFIGNSFAGSSSQPKYWDSHNLSTCDAYKVNPTWIDIIRKTAADGRAPRNFDPETMQPLDPLKESEAAAAWAHIEEQRARELEEQKKAEAARRLAADPNGGQLSIFD